MNNVCMNGIKTTHVFVWQSLKRWLGVLSHQRIVL
jgi:hypothetical protein